MFSPQMYTHRALLQDRLRIPAPGEFDEGPPVSLRGFPAWCLSPFCPAEDIRLKNTVIAVPNKQHH